MNAGERVQRLDADIDLLAARVVGLTAHIGEAQEGITALSEDILGLAESVLKRATRVADLAGRAYPEAPRVAVSSTEVTPADRKVWVAKVDEGDEYWVGPVQVMIEQIALGTTVAFRRKDSDVWSRPYEAEERP
jgi:hypothetical protein